MLSDFQKSKPHRSVSTSSRDTYITRSFRENRTDELAWWWDNGVVQAALKTPKHQNEVLVAILDGLSRGLDMTWTSRLDDLKISHLFPKLHSGPWLCNWMHRPELLDWGVDVCKMNPFTELGYGSSHKNAWESLCEAACGDGHFYFSPDTPRPPLSRVHDWINKAQPKDLEIAGRSALSTLTWMMGKTPSESHLQVDFECWRDRFLSAGASSSEALERWANDIRYHTDEDDDEATNNLQLSWGLALRANAVGLSLQNCVALLHWKPGASMMQADWKEGKSSPWVFEKNRWRGNGDNIETIFDSIYPVDRYEFDRVPTLECAVKCLEAMVDFADKNPETPPPITWMGSALDRYVKSLEFIKVQPPKAITSREPSLVARELLAWSDLISKTPQYNCQRTLASSVRLMLQDRSSEDVLRWLKELDSARPDGSYCVLKSVSFSPLGCGELIWSIVTSTDPNTKRWVAAKLDDRSSGFSGLLWSACLHEKSTSKKFPLLSWATRKAATHAIAPDLLPEAIKIGRFDLLQTYLDNGACPQDCEESSLWRSLSGAFSSSNTISFDWKNFLSHTDNLVAHGATLSSYFLEVVSHHSMQESWLHDLEIRGVDLMAIKVRSSATSPGHKLLAQMQKSHNLKQEIQAGLKEATAPDIAAITRPKKM